MRASGYELRRWSTPEELRRLTYSAYWNDEEAERDKEWWTQDGDFARMEAYVDETTTLGRQLADALADAPPRGEGADLAAGTLWAVPRLLAAGADKVYAVEYSEHRLTRLGPGVLEHYGIPPERVVLCLGSFYELGFADGELGFVLLSQALHHADDTAALLREVRRVLAPDGVAYVIGEPLPVRRGLLRRSRLVDPLLGDHLHTWRSYGRMFRSAGMRVAATREYRDGVAFVSREGR